jgi:hypothetical protein
MSIIEGGSGQVTCLISGPIDVAGVLYTIKAATILVPASAGRWYISLEDGGTTSYLTPTLTDDPGTYDETQFARYTSAGKRILNCSLTTMARPAELARGKRRNIQETRITSPTSTASRKHGSRQAEHGSRRTQNII